MELERPPSRRPPSLTFRDRVEKLLGCTPETRKTQMMGMQVFSWEWLFAKGATFELLHHGNRDTEFYARATRDEPGTIPGVKPTRVVDLTSTDPNTANNLIREIIAWARYETEEGRENKAENRPN